MYVKPCQEQKQQQICENINLFNSPYHKFCLFRLFWYQSKTPKQTEKKCLLSPKKLQKTTGTDWVSVSFGLFQFKPRKKKINCFEVPLKENVSWRFFGLFQQSSVCFNCFHTGPKQTETNRKTTETDWVSVCSGSNRKKIWLFRGHPI